MSEPGCGLHLALLLQLLCAVRVMQFVLLCCWLLRGSTELCC